MKENETFDPDGIWCLIALFGMSGSRIGISYFDDVSDLKCICWVLFYISALIFINKGFR